MHTDVSDELRANAGHSDGNERPVLSDLETQKPDQLPANHML
jgi:hypothetical protein